MPRSGWHCSKKARAGRLNLFFLDECGFSPTQPTGSSWTRRGQRRNVAYENPQRRRVNVLAAYNPFTPDRPLRFLARPRTLTSTDVLALLRRLATSKKLTIVVLDNVGIHTSHIIRRAIPELRRQGLRLFYLPAYCPELNEIESVFGAIKRYGLPERSYCTLDELLAAVRKAFRAYRRSMSEK